MNKNCCGLLHCDLLLQPSVNLAFRINSFISVGQSVLAYLTNHAGHDQGIRTFPCYLNVQFSRKLFMLPHPHIKYSAYLGVAAEPFNFDDCTVSSMRMVSLLFFKTRMFISFSFHILCCRPCTDLPVHCRLVSSFLLISVIFIVTIFFVLLACTCVCDCFVG